MTYRPEPERIRKLNRKSVCAGEFVLYWMASAARAEDNPALEYAVIRANDLGLPVLAVFELIDDFPGANLRHYRFLLEGLVETKRRLAGRGIALIIARPADSSCDSLISLAERSAFVVTDSGVLRFDRLRRRRIANSIGCALVEVETETIIPSETLTDKEEYSAATIRRKINRLRPNYLQPIGRTGPIRDSLAISARSYPIDDIGRALDGIELDRSVAASPFFVGGANEAERLLAVFLEERIGGYDKFHNHPELDYQSELSPYLHFGQISANRIAIAALESAGEAAEPFIEQLLVRRELAINFCKHNPDYDTPACLPNWARQTLAEHETDKREPAYSAQQLENGDTADLYWNAAQREMTITGKMHGYMRMYWGKKVIEWSRTTAEAYSTLVYLNDRYSLDGRDANGYAGIAWCFGKHDRPWGERPIFGKVRYMNAAGLKRKFDMPAYLEKINRLGRPAPPLKIF